MKFKIHAVFLLVCMGGLDFVQSQELTLEEVNSKNSRPIRNDADGEFWMTNMLAYHRFSDREVGWAAGLDPDEVATWRKKLADSGKLKPSYPADRLLVLPYPGGRHPRTGFLDGALRPQRETKVSVFLPWDPASYVVVDVPEAIWSNLGLTYLAHTHIPTVFEKEKKKLKTLEWDRKQAGKLSLVRRLPNGIEFSSEVVTAKDHVRMHMTLKNGTKNKLSDLRVQNCVMLKAAKGFDQQTNDNKKFFGPYVTCHNEDQSRWIITAWKPNHRPWANAPCPCLHSDPKFPDCEPGQTKRLEGWLSFYEGKTIEKEIARLEKLKWWESPSR